MIISSAWTAVTSQREAVELCPQSSAPSPLVWDTWTWVTTRTCRTLEWSCCVVDCRVHTVDWRLSGEDPSSCLSDDTWTQQQVLTEGSCVLLCVFSLSVWMKHFINDEPGFIEVLCYVTWRVHGYGPASIVCCCGTDTTDTSTTAEDSLMNKQVTTHLYVNWSPGYFHIQAHLNKWEYHGIVCFSSSTQKVKLIQKEPQPSIECI